MYTRGRRDRLEELTALYARLREMDVQQMYTDIDLAVRTALYERIDELTDTD